MSGIYTPAEGLFFRLLGYESQKVIYSNKNRTPEVGQSPAEEENQDQYFSLIRHPKNNDLVAFKSKKSGNVLFSHKHAPYVGHTAATSRDRIDNWFVLMPGKDQYGMQFRIVNKSEGVALRSCARKGLELFNTSSKESSADQYFSFRFEDMNIDKVEFDLKSGKVLSSTPVTLGSQQFTNDDKKQSRDKILNISAYKMHTSNFEYTKGFFLPNNTNLKAGIPRISEQNFIEDKSTNASTELGKQSSFSRTLTKSIPVKAGPRETVRVTLIGNEGNLEVPFVIYLSSKSNGVKARTRGIWRGLSIWDTRYTICNVTDGA